MKPLLTRIFVCIFLAAQVPITAEAALISFPGAEGFGRFTTGGRGGDLCIVRNLNDAGSGSYRSCMERSGKRIVIFKVGGTIALKSRVKAKGDVTIFGQTAPGKDGIVITQKTNTFAPNTIMRGMRYRVGSYSYRPGINGIDTVAFGKNTIVDHSSFSWGSDETVQMWTRSQGSKIENVTFQWSIISEGLNDPKLHAKGFSHGYGLLLADLSEHVSIHHNIFAYNTQRNPRVKGRGVTEIINNVGIGSGVDIIVGDDEADEFSASDPLRHHANVINNYYYQSSGVKIGPGVGSKSKSKIYVSGNKNGSGKTIGPIRMRSNTKVPSYSMVSTPAFSGSGITTQSASEARDLVLKYAGANVPRHDAADTRVITRRGKNINTESQVGGYPKFQYSTAYPTDSDDDGIPDSWEKAKGLNPNKKDSTTFAPSGYMWIEEYANSLIPRPGYEANAGVGNDTSDTDTDTNQGNTQNDSRTNDSPKGGDTPSTVGTLIRSTYYGALPWCDVFQDIPYEAPAGFGTAYLPFLAYNGLILEGYCSFTTGSETGAAGIVIPAPDIPGIQYIWHTGYMATEGGTWEKIEFIGERVAGTSGWINGEVQGANYSFTTTKAALREPHVFLAYTCSWVENAWKCGCRDASCTSSHWQLQAVQLK
ncbi:MAG: hypothetical protein LR017_01165 [Candidatus Pacebacteria bacterium]|nr:hypothetical protein [Candidatus Paceibacterota bacterium]